MTPANEGICVYVLFTQDEPAQIERITQDLIRRFAGIPTRVISNEVKAGVKAFEGAHVRTFVPILVEKRAKDHLRHRAGSRVDPRTYRP